MQTPLQKALSLIQDEEAKKVLESLLDYEFRILCDVYSMGDSNGCGCYDFKNDEEIVKDIKEYISSDVMFFTSGKFNQ